MEVDYTQRPGGPTGRLHGPRTALMQAYWERVKPLVQQLHDEGWPVTAEMVNTEDGRFVALLGCQLDLRGLAPDTAHMGSVLPLVPARVEADP
jgi:hypothetical protein